MNATIDWCGRSIGANTGSMMDRVAMNVSVSMLIT